MLLIQNFIFLILREEMMAEIIWEAEVDQEVMVLVVIVIQMSTEVGIDDQAALCKIRSKRRSLFHLPNVEL